MRFSIIIPAYNAADSLARCLDSVLGQTFGDFQILVVDDGSVDGTVGAALEYARRDRRVLLIESAHLGPGAARNLGLKQASGEYVLYLDADDYWVDSELLDTLSDHITRQPGDVFLYQMVKVTETGSVLTRYTKPPFEKEGKRLPLREVYSDLVRDGQTLASACNKCVRRTLLEQRDIRFREDVIGEDIDWVLELFSHTRTICLLNRNAYAYTQHKGESRSRHPDAPNDLIRIVADWAGRLDREEVSHREAVAGLVAFEYGICMGSYHRMSLNAKQAMRAHTWLLDFGLDRKTAMICKFYRVFGFHLTCFAIRIYLLLRRIW